MYGIRSVGRALTIHSRLETLQTLEAPRPPVVISKGNVREQLYLRCFVGIYSGVYVKMFYTSWGAEVSPSVRPKRVQIACSPPSSLQMHTKYATYTHPPTHPEGVAGWRGPHLYTPPPPSPLSSGLIPIMSSLVNIYTSYSSSYTVRDEGRVGVTYTRVVHTVIPYFEVEPSARISMFLPQYLYYFWRNTPPTLPSPLRVFDGFVQMRRKYAGSWSQGAADKLSIFGP